MAKEISRSFDHALGAVVVRIEQSEGGAIESHTLYVAATEVDVEREVAARIQAAEERHARVCAAFRRAGWTG